MYVNDVGALYRIKTWVDTHWPAWVPALPFGSRVISDAENVEYAPLGIH